MFSSGQIIFAIIFALVFVIIVTWTYRKDKKLHDKNYKGFQWVGIFFIIFLAILFCIKYLLKK
ncbi:MAG: hypothetical protein MUO53_15510 [Maribacter sp.]|nr:hypothetical protein [Maribacter sp.]